MSAVDRDSRIRMLLAAKLRDRSRAEEMMDDYRAGILTLAGLERGLERLAKMEDGNARRQRT